MSFFNYAAFYAEMAARQDFTTFVELGVYAGDSLAFLLSKLKTRGIDFDLYGIDLWEQARERTAYFRPIDPDLRRSVEDRFRGFQSVHLIQEETSEAARLFKDGSVDFVFIDANHSEEFVSRDIAAWLPKVRCGGIIAGHDFREPCGVEAAVIKAFGAGNFSVVNTVWYKVIS